MTKTIRLPGIAAVLLGLSFGNAHAEDAAEPPPTQTVTTQDQAKPKPKEETPSQNESKSSASKEEPECN